MMLSYSDEPLTCQEGIFLVSKTPTSNKLQNS